MLAFTFAAAISNQSRWRRMPALLCRFIMDSFLFLFSFYFIFYFCTIICPQERLLTLKRSMSFMQDMDFSQQAAILGDEDIAAEEPQPAVISTPVESAKKSKKQPHHREPIIRYGNSSTCTAFGHYLIWMKTVCFSICIALPCLSPAFKWFLGVMHTSFHSLSTLRNLLELLFFLSDQLF